MHNCQFFIKKRAFPGGKKQPPPEICADFPIFAERIKHLIMIRFKKLDHVAIMIPAGKKEEAKAFYGNILQLKEIPGNHPRGATWYEIADIQLHLVEEEGDTKISGRHPAFEVGDLEAAKQFLESKGISIAYSSLIVGRQRLFFRDPFGNRVELLEFD